MEQWNDGAELNRDFSRLPIDVQNFLESESEFLRKLLQKYPDLTDPELIVCAVMRNYQRSWQIAKKIFRAEKTIENHRTDLRKKFGLPKTQHLPDFLKSI